MSGPEWPEVSPTIPLKGTTMTATRPWLNEVTSAVRRGQWTNFRSSSRPTNLETAREGNTNDL